MIFLWLIMILVTQMMIVMFKVILINQGGFGNIYTSIHPDDFLVANDDFGYIDI